MPLAMFKLKSIRGVVTTCLNDILGIGWKMEQQLLDQWERIVGVEFAENVKISSLKNGVLTLNCFHPVWLMELKFEKKIIEQKINKSNLGFKIRLIVVESSW